MATLTPLLVFGLAIAQHAFGFSFNTSTPNQCGQLTIQWDGGQEPFQFVLVPTIEVSAGHIQNISIPRGLSQPYSYTFDLEQPAGLEFLATMYDSTGFGSGGTTPVLTVGSSDNTSCLTTDLNYSFTFSISPSDNPSQCSSQTVTWPSSVTRPVNLFGLIPGGTAFQVPIPQDGTSYDWQVNIIDGTQYLLAMSDAGPDVTGGSSPLITVGSGSDSCMNSTSPRAGGGSGSGSGTATSAGPSASASVSGVGGGSSGGTSGGNGSGQDNSGDGGSGGGGSSTPVGAIVGGTVGGVAFLVLLVVLLFFCLRKRARERRDSADPIIRSYGANGAQTTEKRRTGAMDLLAGRGGRAERALSDDSQVEAGLRGDEYQPSPFRYPDSAQAAGMTGAAAGAGAGNRNSLPASEKTGTPHAAAFATSTGTRPSFESGNTTTNTHPTSALSNTAAAAVPPQTESGRTDMATLGHGVQRNSSIAKHGQHGSAPGDSPATAGRPLPGTPTQRFVQHEDSGEVVDLPPRYDQLRARNPDPA